MRAATPGYASCRSWLRQVDELNVAGCRNLERLPEKLRVASWLDLADTGLRILPPSARGFRLRWRGVAIGARSAFHPETVNGKEILKERNAEVRRVMLERVGYEQFLRQVEAETLDEDEDAGGPRGLCAWRWGRMSRWSAWRCLTPRRDGNTCCARLQRCERATRLRRGSRASTIPTTTILSPRPDARYISLPPGSHAKGIAGPVNRLRRACESPRDLRDGLHVRWITLLDPADRARGNTRPPREFVRTESPPLARLRQGSAYSCVPALTLSPTT